MKAVLRNVLPVLAARALGTRRRRAKHSIARRILVIKLDDIGDFVLFSPFLRQLRRLYPIQTITLLVSNVTAALAEKCPYVDGIIVVKPKREMGTISYLKYLAQKIRPQLLADFDLTLQPRWDADIHFANLLVYWARSPLAIGFTEKTSPEKYRLNRWHDAVFSHVLPCPAASHEVEKCLEIIRHLGGDVAPRHLEVWLGDEDFTSADQFFEELKPEFSPSIPTIAFGIGASNIKRQWPGYASLIEILSRQMDFNAVLIAGPLDSPIADRINSQIRRPVPTTCGRPLRTMAAILKRCRYYIGNDSGPMHVASAVGLPVVMISCMPQGSDSQSPSSPDRFGPFCARKIIVRPGSGDQSGTAGIDPIATISVHKVAEAFVALNRETIVTKSTANLPPIQERFAL